MAVGRPKEFDEEEVVDRAMDLFWSRGYQGLGVAELLQHMGISRQSLYDTFGNKRRLFIRVIEHYRVTQLAHALALLERDGSRVENVKAVFRFFEDLALDERGRGCLVANALVEVGPHDPEIAELLRRTLGVLQDGIRRALEQAEERGELSSDLSPLRLSRVLVSALIGLVVMGKLRPSETAIRDVARGTLAILG